MSAQNEGDGMLVLIAVAAAFAAGLVAVAQHAYCTSAGYELAVAQRENIELRRAADQIERRVTSMRTPAAATSRLAAMKLVSLKYPKTWNVVDAATLRSCLAPATPSLPSVPMIPVSSKGGAK